MMYIACYDSKIEKNERIKSSCRADSALVATWVVNDAAVKM